MKYDREKIKQIILTDYLDNSLKDQDRKEIKSYIAKDPELMVFYQKVLKKTVFPFEKISNQKTPLHIWDAIEQQLDVEDRKNNYFDFVLDKVILFWKKPQFVWVGFAFTFIFISVIIVNRIGTLQYVRYNQEAQIEYLMILAESSSVLINEPENNATNIEKYFL